MHYFWVPQIFKCRMIYHIQPIVKNIKMTGTRGFSNNTHYVNYDKYGAVNVSYLDMLSLTC